jgi:ABC-type antimicrobial peptide transport system, ATPase component
MLEVRNLCKTYRSKDGVSVEATKDISLRFPERGMVFLLGRSGSGKSTLLHLLGGLDRYDSGEILINGTSTRDFSNSMMDSYRNTYVGFVFQDYNILPEFNVGANIALALELQGIRATNERINEILREVDLAEYAKRRPNELSGGQLQRVAIARALIKDPDIILADEPTGALDSSTGRQVFETLKRLSKRKLVIIVSHDRDYSEQYADRIIELADGRVISDMELSVAPVENEDEAEENIEFRPEMGIRADKDGLTVAPLYELTEEDRIRINRFLELQKDNNVLLLEGTKLVPKKDRFKDTDQEKIVPEKTEFAPVKSKLPWKRSFGIGLNSLKYKKVTLVFTVLLSIVAFVLFGLADVFYSFDKINCITDSIWESEVTFLQIEKSRDYTNWSYDSDFDFNFTEAEIREIGEKTGQKPIPVSVSGYWGSFWNMRFVTSREMDQSYFYAEPELYQALYPTNPRGIIELDEERLKTFGADLVAGRLPKEGTDEVCISTLAAEMMLKYGNRDIYKNKTVNDLVGMKLTVESEDIIAPTICGVIDLKIDVDRYHRLIPTSTYNLSDAEKLLREIYMSICRSECANGLPAFLFCAMGSTNLIGASKTGAIELYDSVIEFRLEHPQDDYTYYSGGMINRLLPLSQADLSKVLWLDGRPRTTLADNEMIVTAEILENLFWDELYSMFGEFYYDGMDQREIMKAVSALLKEKESLFSVEFSDGTAGKIVGMYLNKIEDTEDYYYRENDTAILNDAKLDSYREEESETCSLLITRMPSSRNALYKLVEYGNNPDTDMRLSLNNSSTFVIDELDDMSRVLSPVFKWIGIVFAAFSAVLFAVFIANSVIHKKQEIGVLRAIGARSLDVYRIFLSETGVIAAFNWIVAAGLVFAIVRWINSRLQGDYLYNLVLLHFGVRQVLLIFVIAIGIALVATFLPIWSIARRKPIDVIRDR